SQADLLQCVTDGAVTVWQQHAEVVLGTGIRKLLHCNVVCRVLLEECCVIWIRCSILTNWNVTGLAGPVASVRGVGEEVDELQSVVLTLLRDARWDSQACATGWASALAGWVRKCCYAPVEACSAGNR